MNGNAHSNRQARQWAVVASTPAEPSRREELGSGYHLRNEARSVPISGRAEYCLRWADEELEIPLGTEFSIGRASECLLQLKGKLVSRHHARVRHVEEGVIIEDLASLNGVLVNRTRISTATLLHHGDVVNVGDEFLEILDMERVRRSARLSTVAPDSRGGARADTCRDEGELSIPPLHDLGDDERELLEQLVLGHTEREIALSLNLSVGAVERLRARLSKRIDCHSRGELVTYAICSGLMRGR